MLSPDTFLLFKSYLDTLKNGPYEEDYFKVTEWMFRANREGASNKVVPLLFQSSLWDKNYPGPKSLFHRIANAGRVVGNYAIMQDLYTGYVNAELSEHDQRWDQYIQSQISSLAVRHRVAELRSVLEGKYYHSILDVACGSGICADVVGTHKYRVERYLGIDTDIKAIKYCQEQFDGREKSFSTLSLKQLTSANLGTFDLVWCSGLFDYFSSDIVFMRAARILLEMSRDTVVIGNMGPANMTVPMMNLLGWKLCYRTKDHLKQLAQGMKKKYGTFKTFEVTSDPTGIQHYLYLHK